MIVFHTPPGRPDLEIVAFHRICEVKSLQILNRERESLRSALPLACKNLGA